MIPISPSPDTPLAISPFEFVELLFNNYRDGSFRDCCYPCPKYLKIVEHYLPELPGFHIQYKNHKGEPLQVPVLWEKRAWSTAAEKYLQDKKDMDNRVANFEKKKQKVGELAVKLVENMGLDADTARIVASGIVMKDNHKAAALHGVIL